MGDVPGLDEMLLSPLPDHRVEDTRRCCPQDTEPETGTLLQAPEHKCDVRLVLRAQTLCVTNIDRHEQHMGELTYVAEQPHSKPTPRHPASAMHVASVLVVHSLQHSTHAFAGTPRDQPANL